MRGPSSRPCAVERSRRRRAARAGVFAVLLVSSCGWNPSRPFDREAPEVRRAVADLDAGDAGSAASELEAYLSTGACKDGNIGTPELLKRRADGTFDLGLALFRVGEQFGRRFGDEEIDASADEGAHEQRHAQVECARRIVDAIADSNDVDLERRARTDYLAGNLAFLDGDYEGAVRAYDRALVLSPGEVDAADSTGRDAAWNRAIALRRIEDKKDAGQDAATDAGQDASKDGGPPDASRDAGQDGSPDTKPDGGGPPDAGPDGGQDAGSPPPPQPPDAGPEHPDAAPPPPSRDEDERMLDQLENAPTLQQEEAKRAGKKRVRGMADK
jgi:tetratricopeptide (TPR) repeat protein